jgi:glycosyltransferase involved in cell wall biosynthesis
VKVIFINTLFFPIEVGGAEKSLRKLIAALKSHSRIRPVVITLNNKSPVDDVVDHVDGVKIYRLGYRNTRFVFDERTSLLTRAMWHLKEYDNDAFDTAIGRIFDDEKPDLVHTNNLLGFSARPIYLARKWSIPVVHTLRDYYFQCWKSSKFASGKNCKKPCISCNIVSHKRKSYSAMASYVVGNSSFILADHKRYAAFSDVPKSSVIYNIYEPDAVAQPRKAPTADCIRLGYMGRLNKEKGITELVDLVKGIRGYQLIIAGIGDQAGYVEAAAAEYENIFYLGYCEPKDLIANIDILVVPSIWNEPLSRTIFEAYSYGVPVIGSSCGGTPEIIEEFVTGAIFDPAEFSSIFSLAASICRIPELFEEISKNCLEYSKKFSADAIANSYFNVYMEVLNGELKSEVQHAGQ